MYYYQAVGGSLTSQAIFRYFPDQLEFTEDEINGKNPVCEIDDNGAQFEPEKDSCDMDGVVFTDIHASAAGDRGCNQVECYRSGGFTLPDGTVIDAAEDSHCQEWNHCESGGLGGVKYCGFQCLFD